jgi:predicted nucleic acid-binding protein
VETNLAWPTVPIESHDTLEAIRIADTHRIAYWDALIVRAAIKSGASTLLTDDLGHGQIIEQIEVIDPFHR